MDYINPTGRTVIVLAGKFAGQEGVCLGAVTDGSGLWAVSPNSSSEIVSLEFPAEFGIVLNAGQESERN